MLLMCVCSQGSITDPDQLADVHFFSGNRKGDQSAAVEMGVCEEGVWPTDVRRDEEERER